MCSAGANVALDSHPLASSEQLPTSPAYHVISAKCGGTGGCDEGITQVWRTVNTTGDHWVAIGRTSGIYELDMVRMRMERNTGQGQASAGQPTRQHAQQGAHRLTTMFAALAAGCHLGGRTTGEFADVLLFRWRRKFRTQ